MLSGRILPLLLALAPLSAAAAQTPAPAEEPSLRDQLAAMAARLPALLAEGADLAPAFTPEFFADVPLPQVAQVFAGLRSQHGAPQSVGPLMPGSSAGNGVVVVSYDRADVTMALAVDASGRIAGLRITGVAARDDSLARISAELASLPGTVGWGVYRLGEDGRADQIAGTGDGEHLAIGSIFKLAVLGALDAEIAAGRMRWSDVITLDQPSVPSGMTQDWPVGTPITLQAAAQLMISISDNTATDLLIRHIGRERIEAFARAHGGLSGPDAFPLLTTIEASVLKNPALGPARAEWLAGNAAQRRAVLARHAALFVPANVDYGAYARPADIMEIEWFASADSIARLLGWYAREASDTARAIIAVNPGIPSGNARQWAYVGYKGGSEPGVIAMSLLLRARDGADYAVVMTWNNEAASVDDSRLAGLAARAAAVIRQPPAN
jgi:hypothetical protein